MQARVLSRYLTTRWFLSLSWDVGDYSSRRISERHSAVQAAFAPKHAETMQNLVDKGSVTAIQREQAHAEN